MKEKHCDIFISYRRDGGDMTAMYIYQALKERKYDVFYDLEVLRAGKFNDALLEYIDACRDFVLILSPHALDRCNDENDWVRKEIAEALRLKKNIIPIMMKGFTFPEVLPEDIDDVRYQNGMSTSTEYFTESINRLCNKYLNAKPKKKTKIIVPICILAVLLIAGGFFGSKLLTRQKPEPAAEPVPLVTDAVTEEPTAGPTAEPTEEPTAEPTPEPTEEPAAEPATEPTNETAPLTLRVQIGGKNDEYVDAPYKYDPATNTTYAFVPYGITAQVANSMRNGLSLSVNSAEELEFLEKWSFESGLDFGDTWTAGSVDCPELYISGVNPKKLWRGTAEKEGLYLKWSKKLQPDGSGHWLQLWSDKKSDRVNLTMDDVNDDLRRSFILELEGQYTPGSVIDVVYPIGGTVETGYGELIYTGMTSEGRLDDNGVLTVRGTGITEIMLDDWYNLYIRKLIIEEGITGIEFHSFDSCRNLTEVVLASSVTMIGEMAFSNTGLKDIFIPETVTSIHPMAFYMISDTLTIHAKAGSYAETYAKEQGIKFIAE